MLVDQGAQLHGQLVLHSVIHALACFAAFQDAGPGEKGEVLGYVRLTALPTLPLVAAIIGWGSAQITVRGWLHTLCRMRRRVGSPSIRKRRATCSNWLSDNKGLFFPVDILLNSYIFISRL